MDQSRLDENGNDLSFTSVFDDSFSGTFHHVTSTPRKADRFKLPAHPAHSSRTPGRPPKPSKAVKKVLQKQRQALKVKTRCDHCPKEYVSAYALKNHKRLHAIEAAASKFPDEAAITQELPSIVMSTLDKICDSLVACDVTAYAAECTKLVHGDNSFQEFTQQVCQLFISVIQSKKFLLPSKLLEALVQESERVLSDSLLRSDLVLLLSCSVQESDEEVLQLFLCKYIISFCEELLKFISLSVCSVSIGRRYECDDHDREILHFIGGAKLRHFIKRARRFPTSRVWNSIKDTILNRMIESDSVVGACMDDKSWTEAKDRGNLIKVSDDCLEFLVCLAEIIENSEQSDGSLSYLSVYKKVCNSMAMSVYWDSMISDSLSENVSTIFLRSFTKAVCQTYGNGIHRRRMNTMNDKPTVSLSLRHQVASSRPKVS